MHRGYEGRISRRIRAGMEFVLEKGFPPCAEVAGEEIGQDGADVIRAGFRPDGCRRGIEGSLFLRRKRRLS